MVLCLARWRGQEKIVDELEKEQRGGGGLEEAGMIERRTNGQSECGVRGGEGMRREVESW